MPDLDVALVLMPYGVIETPSMALGQLTGGLKNADIRVQGFFANIWFAEKIGLSLYNEVLGRASRQIGEWTFAPAAFPDFTPDPDAFFDLIPNLAPPLTREALLVVRHMSSDFIDETAERIMRHNPAIVGCSSLFQQNCASLALLRRIKSINPAVITIMGGGVFDGSVANLVCTRFPWVDFAVTGEADLLFPELCRKLLDKGAGLGTSEIPAGVVSAHQTSTPDRQSSMTPSPTVMVPDIMSVPYPDFNDYFKALHDSPLNDEVAFRYITFETSRGCWWHERTHGGCSFCTMPPAKGAFRAKTPERVMDELAMLRKRHGINWFSVADDIFANDYYENLLPLLKQVEEPYEMYIVMKATSSEEKIAALAAAHILHGFSGMESLHDRILRLMQKGVTALGNIAQLKFSLENGFDMMWNFLHSVPGEDDRWYEEMEPWIEQLVHLQAPDAILPICMFRNSRYHREEDKYGLKLVPSAPHSFVYPLSADELRAIAFFLDVEGTGGTDAAPQKQVTRVITLIREWQERFYCINSGAERPVLEFVCENGGTRITDTRQCAVEPHFILNGLEHLVHEGCRRPVMRDYLVRQLSAGLDGSVTRDEVETAVDYLRDRKLVLQVNEKILALATRPPKRRLLTVYEMMQQ